MVNKVGEGIRFNMDRLVVECEVYHEVIEKVDLIVVDYIVVELFG